MSSQPNVLIIITDQQRYDSMSCTGNPHALTPHLDALAAESTVFDRCISANSICEPSRASLLTGLHCSGHGVWTNGVPLPRNDQVPESEFSRKVAKDDWVVSHVPTAPDVFGAAGYGTASVGKLHLTPFESHCDLTYCMEASDRWRADPSMPDWHGPYFGFQHVDLSIGHGEPFGAAGHYQHWLDTEHPEISAAVAAGEHRKNPEFPELGMLYPSVITCEAHVSTWIAEHSCHQIEKLSASEQPFFLWVGFPDPHSPFVPPAELAAEFSRHDALLSSVPAGDWPDKPRALRHRMDNGNARSTSLELIRRMRQYTDAMMHLLDRGIGRIVQTLKDTGEWDNTIIVFTSDHGDYLGDYGMHGKDMTCGKPLNHIPLMLRVPGGDLPARTPRAVSNVDVLPTLCELAGVTPPAHMHGESIGRTLAGERQSSVMVQHYCTNPPGNNISIYDDRWRYTWYPVTDEHELYDHDADPHELHNLAADPASQSERTRLHAALANAQCRTQTPCNARYAVW